MKIFIDSARLDEIEKAYKCGVLDGVTTNPTLIKKAYAKFKETPGAGSFEDYIKKILVAARGTPVSLEVTAHTYDGMVEQGRRLFYHFNPVAGNVCIKVPANPSFAGETERDFDGIRAIKTLSDSGVPVNATLIFTPEQALFAADAGAKMVSPYVGRTDDYIRTINRMKYKPDDYFPAGGLKKKGFKNDKGIVSGIDLVAKTVQIFSTYGIRSEVLAASIRSQMQMREAALAGADIATVPMKVIDEIMDHPKSQEGMKLFKEDTVPEYERIGRR